MGILDRLRKKPEKEPVISREKTTEFVNLLIEDLENLSKNYDSTRSYLNKLNEEELKAVLKIVDLPVEGYGLGGVKYKHSIDSDFPGIKNVLKDVLKKREVEAGKLIEPEMKKLSELREERIKGKIQRIEGEVESERLSESIEPEMRKLAEIREERLGTKIQIAEKEAESEKLSESIEPEMKKLSELREERIKGKIQRIEGEKTFGESIAASPLVAAGADYKEYGRLTESKEKFVPFGSLLKDTTGSFPRRKKTGIEKFQKIRLPQELKFTEKHEPSQLSFFSKLKRAFRIKISREDEIKLEKQRALQEVVEKLYCTLTDWWGIPRFGKEPSPPGGIYYTRTPKVKIVDKTNEGIVVASADGILKLNRYILVNEIYLDNKYQNDLNRALAQEVFRSLEDDVRGYGGRTYLSWYVKEFFSMINRLYIYEQMPELFHYEYQKNLDEAINFSKEKKDYDERIKKIKNKAYYLNRLQNERRELEIERNRLTHYPATAYYYEIKKMTPQERYELLKMGPFKIKKRIIEGKALEKLEEIKKKKLGRKDLKIQREKALKEYPESKQFFAGVAAGAGYKEYGRLTEKVLKTRIPTTKKFEKVAKEVAKEAAVGAMTKAVAPEVPVIPAAKTAKLASKVATTASGLLPKEEHEQFKKEEERELKKTEKELISEEEQFRKEEEELLKKTHKELTEEEQEFEKEEKEELKKAT